MSKINLMDVAFVVPIRLDSTIRIENLLASIAYLIKEFHTNVYVLEAANYNNHILEKLLPKDVSYSFVRDTDPIFHRTRYINELVYRSINKYISIWDADVIIDKEQINEAVSLLRNDDCDIAFPYDGYFYDTTQIIRNVYLELNDIEILKNNINKMILPYGTNMGGGALFIKREKFDNSGGEDESFYGWGPEDWNRMEKWKQLGYRIKRVEGPLFHLTHPRDLNGRFNSEWQKRYANNVLRKTIHGNIEEIKNGIQIKSNSKLPLKDKLHIGCGKCILPEWLNTDIEPYNDDVLFMDATKPFPFPNDIFEYVYSEHVFEHFSFDEMVNALLEILRVLKPGGVMRIAMPSFTLLSNLYMNSDSKLCKKYIEWSIDSFASQLIKSFDFNTEDLSVIVINNFMHEWGHKFIYTPDIFQKILCNVGFTNVKKCAIGESDYKVLKNIEKHGTQIPYWANMLETMVFEAQKLLPSYSKYESTLRKVG